MSISPWERESMAHFSCTNLILILQRTKWETKELFSLRKRTSSFILHVRNEKQWAILLGEENLILILQCTKWESKAYSTWRMRINDSFSTYKMRNKWEILLGKENLKSHSLWERETHPYSSCAEWETMGYSHCGKRISKLIRLEEKESKAYSTWTKRIKSLFDLKKENQNPIVQEERESKAYSG